MEGASVLRWFFVVELNIVQFFPPLLSRSISYSIYCFTLMCIEKRGRKCKEIYSMQNHSWNGCRFIQFCSIPNPRHFGVKMFHSFSFVAEDSMLTLYAQTWFKPVVLYMVKSIDICLGDEGRSHHSHILCVHDFEQQLFFTFLASQTAAIWYTP